MVINYSPCSNKFIHFSPKKMTDGKLVFMYKDFMLKIHKKPILIHAVNKKPRCPAPGFSRLFPRDYYLL